MTLKSIALLNITILLTVISCDTHAALVSVSVDNIDTNPLKVVPLTKEEEKNWANVAAHICNLTKPTLSALDFRHNICEYLGYQKKICAIPARTSNEDLQAVLEKQSCKKGDRIILKFGYKKIDKVAMLCDQGTLFTSTFNIPHAVCEYVGYVRKSEFSED